MQTILIIDDDAAIGDLEQEVLERAGYAVQRAKSVLLDRISEDTPPLSGRSRRPHRDTSPGSTARTASRIATPHKLFSWISLLYPRFPTRERGHFLERRPFAVPRYFFRILLPLSAAAREDRTDAGSAPS